jgi:uncharacterized protein YndB with AHSA1/START domain
MTLPYQLDRIITIRAPREVVFRFFTDSTRWAAWWGAGSTVDARPGGDVLIRYPGNVEVSGEVLEVAPPGRFVMTYGYRSGQPFGPGASRVTILLEDVNGETRLHLTHEFPDAASRDHHVQGWRYQLSLFSNAVANELHADAQSVVDSWLGLWTETDSGARDATLRRIASRDVRFADRFSAIEGAGEVSVHVGAAQRFMPGIRLERRGDVRQCQGMVLAEWAAIAADDSPRGSGTNVFSLGGDGKIAAVTGFWNA